MRDELLLARHAIEFVSKRILLLSARILLIHGLQAKLVPSCIVPGHDGIAVAVARAAGREVS